MHILQFLEFIGRKQNLVFAYTILILVNIKYVIIHVLLKRSQQNIFIYKINV
jgi:hypothetical protein